MENPSQMLAQLGMMNKVSTGYAAVDIMLMMLIPLLLAHATPYLERIKRWLQMAVARGSGKQWQREISWTRKDGYYYTSEDEAPNNLLQQAILMYLGTKEKLVAKYESAQLTLQKRGNQEQDDDTACDDSGSSCDSYDYCGNDPSQQLRNYEVNTVPPLGAWVEVEHQLEFQRSENFVERGEGKRGDTVVTFSLQSAAPDGPAHIDAFVDAAYNHYKRALEEKSQETSRYLYAPTNAGTASSGGDDGKQGMVYKRYQLSDEKTFSSFWHPDKDSILRLTDHFMNKSGKFAIKGFSHRLGLLLHGPPGTGKTSLVKALAHYTDRNIITVPLSQIQTNQQLQDIVFDQKFHVVGDGSLPYTLPFSKTIFLLEDVDAACEVVQRRKSSTLGAAAPVRQRQPKPKPADGEQSSEDGEEPSKVAAPSVMFGPEPAGKKSAFSFMDDPDRLNLAGVLNVLDGCVDTPNRIVVMTTNCPEKLDPALIRPGRISKKIYMGNLALETALSMVEHYFYSTNESADLTPAGAAAFSAVFKADTMSPASLESLCCEFDSIDELTAALGEHFAER